MSNFTNKTIIFANGAVPEHPVPLKALSTAERIICCDGAVDKLVRLGCEPDWVIGDMDSITDSSRACFSECLVEVADQSRNDLTKAFKLCISHGWRDIAVIGATGGREDHTLGNISLLVDFARQLDIVLLSDTGFFITLTDSASIEALSGQQVSVFSFNPDMPIHSEGLKYPLNGIRLNRWWQATLNEAVSGRFSLLFEGGPLLVYLVYND
ncbi:MAG: thiamine diphosphokinase [Kiritimatiellia bacterium]